MRPILSPSSCLACLLVGSQLVAAPAIAGGTDSAEPPGSWVDFAPTSDPFTASAALDLRPLNEPRAGDGGFVVVEAGRFVRGRTRQPIRFWGVNVQPARIGREPLRNAARMAAKRGVNLVRIHGPIFDEEGRLVPERVLRVIEIVEIMKAEGIYSWLSIYFPLWLTPEPGTSWLDGYDGRTHPFAALMFNVEFETRYRAWWTALLTTPSPSTGVRLIDEPAVAGVEIQNEDSFLFPTFDPDRMPEPQRRILETRFGGWLARRHGSVDQALDDWSAARPGVTPAIVGGVTSIAGAWRRGVRHLSAWWKGVALPRDAPADGRAAIRSPGILARSRGLRDQETIRFLVEEQSAFYARIRDFLRGSGFRAAVTTSNWTTARPEILEPLEKMSYLEGDFLDRHVYFDCAREGDRVSYQLQEGHTYRDRSALRLEGEDGVPLAVASPSADPGFDGKASVLSEVSWTRPNRHRSEAPLFLASYGAHQGTDAIVHFALDSDRWSVQPRPFAQPWTLLSPGMMGQFPAAAMIFREGFVAPGDVVLHGALDRAELLRLVGAPWLFAEPLVYLAGQVDMRFTDGPKEVDRAPAIGNLGRDARVVASTSGDLRLDLGRGVLVIDAASAQGASGDLRAAGTIRTKDLEVDTGMRIGHIVAVPMDGRPLSESSRILLQVMSEEQPTGYRSEPVEGGRRRIASLGHDPWQFRRLEGTVRLRRPGAERFRVLALDANGYVAGSFVGADRILLRPDTIHYVIVAPGTEAMP